MEGGFVGHQSIHHTESRNLAMSHSNDTLLPVEQSTV